MIKVFNAFIKAAEAAPFTPASLFGAGEKGGFYDFTDLTKLAVNADGTGGGPAIGGTAKWAVDQSPNANHLRNTVASVAVSASGVTSSGANYGLFNMPGFGDWPAIVQPATIVVRLRQNAFAGTDSRLMGGGVQLLQGAASGDMRFFAGGAYGAAVVAAIGTEATVEGFLNGAASTVAIDGGDPIANNPGTGNMDGVVLGSTTGGGSPTETLFRKLLVIDRALSAAERAGVLAWMTA